MRGWDMKAILVLGLALLFAKAGLLAWETSGWLFALFAVVACVGAWFLQTEEEKQANIDWWRRRL